VNKTAWGLAGLAIAQCSIAQWFLQSGSAWADTPSSLLKLDWEEGHLDRMSQDPMGQVRSVQELSDIQPTDWAYQAVKSLVEKYGVVTGYADRTFRGNRALSRYEFAAVLAVVMTQIEQFFITGELAKIREDFATIKRLQESYGKGLDGLRDRLQKLDAQIDQFEQQQFSTTTKLTGQTVIALTDGSNANTTFATRIRLNLNTSFTGTDRLLTQLEMGNNAGDAISKFHNNRSLFNTQRNLLGTNGILADGGGLDYVEVPNTVQISKLHYTFQPIENLNLTVGARLNPRDFIDRNRFADDSLDNFASSFFMNNPLIIQNAIDRPGGAGAAIAWKPGNTSPFTLRALYVAADANLPGGGLTTGGGLTKGGLLGDRNQGSLELEYSFNKNLVARLQYTTATVNGTAVNAGGFNFEWVLKRQFAFFGRLGIGRYNGFNNLLNQNLDLSPISWAFGGTIRDIGIPGSVAGLALGQPFIESNIGDATQFNVEAYYRFQLNDNVSFSPTFLIVANPNNRAIGTIFEWALQLKYSF
jgi:hypothetical protein